MIEIIKTYHLTHKLEEPFGFSQWQYDTRNALLVEIIDDSGAVGWGECYGPASVTQCAIDTFYAPLLLGWDPLKNETAWSHCWRASLDFAMTGPMMGAISGLDMAMLDLKGKRLGVSVSELLGGRHRDSVDCYATGMYFSRHSDDNLREALIAEAGDYVGRGYGALKIKIGKNMTFDRKLILAMRKAFPEVQLMADSNHAYDLPEATAIGRLLDEHNYTWFEEPLSPAHPELLRQLADKIDVAIAVGECEQTRYGFQALLSQGGVHIAQPDLAYCGGPTEAVKIRAVASSKGINVLPHCWGTQLNLASAVHFLATSYVEPGRAEVAEPLLEKDLTPNPMRDEMYAIGIRAENGSVAVPTEPGLGVEPDRSAMEKFCVNETEKSNAGRSVPVAD